MDVGAATFRNQLGNFYAADTTLLVSQSLLRGFGPTVGRRPLERGNHQVGSARRQHALTEQQLAIEVAGFYYQLIAQQELAVAARTALENAERLLRASEAKLRANLVSQLDVFRAQQLVAVASGQVFDVEGSIDDLKDQLRFAMARDSDVDFRVAAEIDARPDPVTSDAAVRLALANRIELRDAQAAVDEADRDIRFARHQLLPPARRQLGADAARDGRQLPGRVRPRPVRAGDLLLGVDPAGPNARTDGPAHRGHRARPAGAGA